MFSDDLDVVVLGMPRRMEAEPMHRGFLLQFHAVVPGSQDFVDHLAFGGQVQVQIVDSLPVYVHPQRPAPFLRYHHDLQVAEFELHAPPAVADALC